MLLYKKNIYKKQSHFYFELIMITRWQHLNKIQFGPLN